MQSPGVVHAGALHFGATGRAGKAIVAKRAHTFPPKKIEVVLNAAAGSVAALALEAALSKARQAFAQAGLEARVVAVSHSHLTDAVRRAAESDADAVVVGGGDGTLRTGAAALVGSGTPLGILPLGTLNHFAKDLGIPLAFDQAVSTIAQGQVIEVDVGDVNGHIFLNNSSIGLYPAAVAEREELRHRSGGGKWLAMIRACFDVFRRFPLLDVTLEVDGRAGSLTTPFVFVGNNRYDMNLFALGKRSSLTDGQLSVYLTRNVGRAGLLRLALRALMGRLAQDHDFHAFTRPSVEIRTRRRLVRVALDGEVLQLTSPIRYAVRPRALRVLVPAPRATAGEP
jgi:YegS/Rv2252/BmrU family lipid kinase